VFGLHVFLEGDSDMLGFPVFGLIRQHRSLSLD
jgi:hypothetical protein